VAARKKAAAARKKAAAARLPKRRGDAQERREREREREKERERERESTAKRVKEACIGTEEASCRRRLGFKI